MNRRNYIQAIAGIGGIALAGEVVAEESFPSGSGQYLVRYTTEEAKEFIESLSLHVYFDRNLYGEDGGVAYLHLEGRYVDDIYFYDGIEWITSATSEEP